MASIKNKIARSKASKKRQKAVRGQHKYTHPPALWAMLYKLIK